jgi:peptide/nickel transport system permease protein
MIIIPKRLIWFSFIIDIILFLLFLLPGWHWFFSIFITEILMWMLRLIWISPDLLKFILRRLLHMIPIILAVVSIAFFLIYLAPGDIFSKMALDPDIRPETLEQLRENFGLNEPWYIQFLRYVGNVLRGDFGYSEIFKAPVFTLVSQRALNTLLLAGLSLLFAWLFSVPAGVIAATHQYKWQDQTISVLAFCGLSIPNFFLAFLLIYLVSVTGNWLPIGGLASVDIEQMGVLERFLDLAAHLAIPVFVIATSITASLTRIMRANMLEILNQPYIRTARAKGLKRITVVYKHALRNSINPMITILGFQLGNILGGAALVEIVTAYPGLGKLILSALLSQDLYLVAGSLIYGVGLLVLGNLLSDILLAVIDPKIRIS